MTRELPVPLRILHVANFNHKKYGADLYATDRKISNGLIRQGHFVYDFSYRDISRNESPFRTTRIGGSKVNARLIQACENIEPDILLLGHSELIHDTTLREIRRQHPSIRIGLWYVDALFHREKAAHLIERRASIDVIFATTGGEMLKEYGVGNSRTAFIPNMVDPSIETGQAFARSSWNYDFCFCGRDENDMQRRDFIQRLHDKSSTFLKPAFRGCLNTPPLTGAQYLALISSCRMGLNMSRRNDVELYSSDRLAQLMGNGLLTFCPRVPGLKKLFREDEIVYFENLDELLDKLRYYQDNIEAGLLIAENGWKRVHQLCNAEKVCRYMVESLMETVIPSEYEWHEDTA